MQGLFREAFRDFSTIKLIKMAFKTHREESRQNYAVEIQDGRRMNDEQLMLGAVLRIADAMEKSVEDRREVDRRLKLYIEWNAEKSDEIESLRRKISANEGVKTKMRAKNDAILSTLLSMYNAFSFDRGNEALAEQNSALKAAEIILKKNNLIK